MAIIKFVIKKTLPIMICRYSNDLFALKKWRILHIENLTRNKKKFGYQALNELISSILPTFLKYEIEK